MQELEFEVDYFNGDFNTLSKWQRSANQYTVTISRGEVSQEFHYFKGQALNDEPTLDEVLECLVSDWQTLEGSSDFADWADNMGLNSDSIKDRKIYDEVVNQSARLLTLITETDAQELYEKFTA